MKPENDIEQIVRETRAETSPKIDEQILTAAQAALQSAAPAQLNIWKIIMKSPITKFATAAVIIILVLFGLNRFGSSIEGASVVFADVRAAFLSQSWAHLEYDNGKESWYNLKTGDHCHKQLYHWGDNFVYINRTDNLRQWYDPEHGRYIQEDRPVIYPDDVVPEYKPETAWERIVGPWEKTAKQNDSSYWEVKISPDSVNGKDVARFDIYYIDALEQRLLTKQLWADPKTKLPLKIREKLTSQQQKDQNRDYITGVFSFPETGPGSIYDLGVPVDLPIAKAYDKEADPSIEKIFEIVKQHYEDFPKRCRAVIWENDRESEIEEVWRDGEKIHFNHYFNMDGPQYSEYHLDLPATLEEVLEWTKTQPPISIYLDDGIKSYHRIHHPAFDDLKTPKLRVTRSWRKGLPSKAHFIEEHWEFMNKNVKSFQFIDDAPEELKRFIGIRTESGTIRRDHYIDGEHDYIQIRNIWWEFRNGQWEKVREYVNLELAQLPSGHWYESKRKLIKYPNPEKGYSRREVNYTINIELLDEDEFPPDTFNGEKLLEGAEIETY